MKNGFTLIELLSVIIILAIILVIAVPQILSKIESAKVSTYISNEKLLLKSTELYVLSNTDKLPNAIGDVSEISLTELKNNNYMKEMKNPFKTSESCSGYVLITKTDNNKYEYTPHIKCGLQVNTSTEDGLIAHYKLDDYKEPTVNLINPKSSWTLYPECTTDWSIQKLDDYTIKVVALKNNPTLSTWSNVASQSSLTTTSANTTVTYSAEIIERNTNLIYPASNGFGSIEGYEKIENINARTITHNAIWVHGFVIRAGDSTLIKSGDYIIIRNFQIESKPYSTSFVDGERIAVVKDYSAKKNNGIGYGIKPSNDRFNKQNKALSFDGISNYIEIPIYNMFQNSTLSLWTNTSLTYGNQILIGDMSSISLGFLGTSLIGTSGATMPTGTLDNCFVNNQWNYLAVVIENSQISYYCNGKKLSNSSTNLWTWTASPYAYIGRRTPLSGGAAYFFKGSMDDIKIYSRALSEAELKILYSTELFQ